jgi:hypothetical protein
MSHISSGRTYPRWSVSMLVPHPLTPSGIWSIAGEVAPRAWVRVGPPLFASGPSMGSVLGSESLAPENPQVASEDRL